MRFEVTCAKCGARFEVDRSVILSRYWRYCERCRPAPPVPPAPPLPA